MNPDLHTTLSQTLSLKCNNAYLPLAKPYPDSASALPSLSLSLSPTKPTPYPALAQPLPKGAAIRATSQAYTAGACLMLARHRHRLRLRIVQGLAWWRRQATPTMSLTLTRILPALTVTFTDTSLTLIRSWIHKKCGTNSDTTLLEP